MGSCLKSQTGLPLETQFVYHRREAYLAAKRKLYSIEYNKSGALTVRFSKHAAPTRASNMHLEVLN